MIQIKRTPLAQVQTRKQIDIAHDRTQRSLDVVRNGKHQLLTGLQQGFVVAISRFELAFVTVAAVHVPPEDSDEEQHHQQRSGSHRAQYDERAAPHLFTSLHPLPEIGRLLLLEVDNQAVNPLIDLLVVALQPQPLPPRLVVKGQPLAGHPLLQILQHYGDGIPQTHLPRRSVDPHPGLHHHLRIVLGRAEQVAEPAEEIALLFRSHAHRIADQDRIGFDSRLRQGVQHGNHPLDIFAQQRRRARRTQVAVQSLDPLLLAGDQPHDRVQTHLLRLVVRTHTERIDALPYQPEFAFVTILVAGITGHQHLTVCFGLIEMVESLIDQSAPPPKLLLAVVRFEERSGLAPDVDHGRQADQGNQHVTHDDFGAYEFRLFHHSGSTYPSPKDSICFGDFRCGKPFSFQSLSARGSAPYLIRAMILSSVSSRTASRPIRRAAAPSFAASLRASASASG